MRGRLDAGPVVLVEDEQARPAATVIPAGSRARGPAAQDARARRSARRCCRPRRRTTGAAEREADERARRGAASRGPMPPRGSAATSARALHDERREERDERRHARPRRAAGTCRCTSSRGTPPWNGSTGRRTRASPFRTRSRRPAASPPARALPARPARGRSSRSERARPALAAARPAADLVLEPERALGVASGVRRGRPAMQSRARGFGFGIWATATPTPRAAAHPAAASVRHAGAASGDRRDDPTEPGDQRPARARGDDRAPEQQDEGGAA